MLILPKTLLQLWSDYHSTVVDVSAILTAKLDDNPYVSTAALELGRVADRGFGSDWTQRHVDAAVTKLSDRCVRNDRYFCNVTMQQEVDREAACWPTVSEPGWWQVWRPSAASVRANLRIVPFASGELIESELLLIDAPVCMDTEAIGGDAYLCDVPSFVRNDADARIPLILSDLVRQRLAAYASTGTDWIPFCRILGIIRSQPRGQAIEALQISVRKPRFVQPEWSTRLIDEAKKMKGDRGYGSDHDYYFSTWIKLYRATVQEARLNHKGLEDPALAAACGPDFASALLRFSSYYADNMLKNESNPYTGAEGFWTAAATILPAWRDRFPLTLPQVDALLREFDATYDEAWSNSMQDLAMSGLFRFTPEAMSRVRARIAALGSDAPSDGAMPPGVGARVLA
jgi:hypothetical protein